LYCIVVLWPSPVDVNFKDLGIAYQKASKLDLSQKLVSAEIGRLDTEIKAELDAPSKSELSSKLENAKARKKAIDEEISDNSKKLIAIQESIEKSQEPPAFARVMGFDRLSSEGRLMLLVVLSGALGSASFAAWSFAKHKALETYDENWHWWYVLRLPMGMMLALIFYFVLRGGLFNSGFNNIGGTAPAQSVNPYGFVALGALTGMFAGRAAQRLEDIFSMIFAGSEMKRADVPVIDGNLKVVAGGGDTDLIVKGKNFANGIKAIIGSRQDVAVLVSPSEIKVKLLAKEIETPCKLTMVLINPGSAKSAPVEIIVEAAKPAIDGKPLADKAKKALTVVGKYFIKDVKAYVDSENRKVTEVKFGELLVTLEAADIAKNTIKLELENPGGLRSDAVDVAIR
jgi:hypothetical protein